MAGNSHSLSWQPEITTMWNAKYTQNGNPVSATNEYYNSLIPTNSSVVLGFNISYSGTNSIPADLKVN